MKTLTSMMMLTVLVAWSCATPTGMQLSAADEFPTPQAEFVVPAGGEDGTQSWTVEELAVEYGRATDQIVFMDKEHRGMARQHRAWVDDEVSVPAGSVHSFVRGILLSQDFLLLEVHPKEPRVLQLVSLNTGARQTLRQHARYVPVESVGDYANMPGYLMMTVATFERIDVRTLANSMRTMLTDANTQQIIPMGTSNSLLLVGFAPQVANLLEMLRTADAQAPEQPVVVPAADAKKTSRE